MYAIKSNWHRLWSKLIAHLENLELLFNRTWMLLSSPRAQQSISIFASRVCTFFLYRVAAWEIHGAPKALGNATARLTKSPASIIDGIILLMISHAVCNASFPTLIFFFFEPYNKKFHFHQNCFFHTVMLGGWAHFKLHWMTYLTLFIENGVVWYNCSCYHIF